MKICFVAPSIYPCMVSDFTCEKIGGAELQQAFIAKELVKRGYEISIISSDFGQKDKVKVNGCKIYKTYKPSDGIPIARFYYPRLWKTWKALKKADADIYYVRCAGFLAGILRIFCLHHNKKYVFAGAHDTDFIPSENKIRFFRDKILYRYGLHHADAIIVQSKQQHQLLRKNFNRKGVIIKNFLPLPVVSRGQYNGEIILWVATIRKWKRPLQFIRLAQSFPKEKFVMIGGQDISDKKLYEQVSFEANKIENLQFLGFQPLEVTEKYFDKCKIFINTSIHEGFPNTFLQAWRRGIPVISYVDPDNVINDNELGKIVRDDVSLKKALKCINRNLTMETKHHIQNYYSKNHSLAIIDNYERLFKTLLSQI